MKRVLNAGCAGDDIKPLFPNWNVVGMDVVDVDISTSPDALASITNLSFKDGSFDAVYCSDVLEHVYFHEVKLALKEFFRVTTSGGMIFVQSPDISEVCRRIGKGDIDMHTKAYKASCGEILYHDMIYGYQKRVAEGDLYMQHKCGLDLNICTSLLREAGYNFVGGEPGLSFLCTGYKV